MTGRIAQVLYKDAVTGTLEETATGGSRFIYRPDWSTSIACCFPVEHREYEWLSGLHPFFQHLGAEGWLRERQARVAHIKEEDDFGLLLRYGADCIGAVSIKNTILLEQTNPLTEATAYPGRTVSGVQKKLLVVKREGRFYHAAPTGSAPYIAKFNSREIETLVRNEALSLRLATAMLGEKEVTQFTLEEIEGENETALVVTRFDRTLEGQKLRLEDFAQILSKPRLQDYRGKYDAGYEDVAEVIKSYSSRPQIDLARFLSRLIIFALVHNADGHLKNFSLLETPTGLRLSPLYDVINTTMYADKGYDQSFALSINGKKYPLDEIDRHLLESFGLQIGVPEKAVAQIFTNLRNKYPKAIKILTPPEGEGPEGFISRFNEIVSGAWHRILAE